MINHTQDKTVKLKRNCKIPNHTARERRSSSPRSIGPQTGAPAGISLLYCRKTASCRYKEALTQSTHTPCIHPVRDLWEPCLPKPRERTAKNCPQQSCTPVRDWRTFGRQVHMHMHTQVLVRLPTTSPPDSGLAHTCHTRPGLLWVHLAILAIVTTPTCDISMCLRWLPFILADALFWLFRSLFLSLFSLSNLLSLSLTYYLTLTYSLSLSLTYKVINLCKVLFLFSYVA